MASNLLGIVSICKSKCNLFVQTKTREKVRRLVEAIGEFLDGVAINYNV